MLPWRVVAIKEVPLTTVRLCPTTDILAFTRTSKSVIGLNVNSKAPDRPVSVMIFGQSSTRYPCSPLFIRQRSPRKTRGSSRDRGLWIQPSTFHRFDNATEHSQPRYISRGIALTLNRRTNDRDLRSIYDSLRWEVTVYDNHETYLS